MKSYPQKQGRDYTRMKVRERDNFTCKMCGNRRTPAQAKQYNKKLFDVHHLKGMCGKKSKMYDKIESIPDMITLCHRCHFNHPKHRFKIRWGKLRFSVA